MSKLGVGVGDEFPAEQVHEIRTDENGVVHHHHYYRRRRGGFLRVILWIMLIGLLFRAVNFLSGPDDWGWRDHGAAWREHAGWSPYYGLAGIVTAIVVIGGALWFSRCIGRDGRN
jgi:hypothetical protein